MVNILGFKDSDYKELGVEISTNETETLNKARYYYSVRIII